VKLLLVNKKPEQGARDRRTMSFRGFVSLPRMSSAVVVERPPRRTTRRRRAVLTFGFPGRGSSPNDGNEDLTGRPGSRQRISWSMRCWRLDWAPGIASDTPAPVYGLVMDPYRTLGIRRGCTRQEAKDAFRARAWHVHPDRGGDEKAFIQLDTAYKLILRELAFVPSNTSSSPARVPGNSPASHPFDPNWDPELIVLVGSPPMSRPPKQPDPSWDPEMILLDEPPRPSRPFDPSWDPEIVVLDEPARLMKTPDLNSATGSNPSWLQKLSDLNNRGNSLIVSARARFILTTTLLILIVVGLLILIVA
jgi:DnaJ domain